MFDVEAHFREIVGRGFDATPVKGKKKSTPKESVLNKLNADLKTLEGIKDVDDLGYGTVGKAYTNKKQEEIVGRMKSWSGRVNAKGKREVRLVLGTAIAFDGEGKRLQFAVENTVKAVKEMMETLRDGVEKMDANQWEEISTNMAKVNKMRRERKEANKRKK
jgi:hypothetical protein